VDTHHIDDFLLEDPELKALQDVKVHRRSRRKSLLPFDPTSVAALTSHISLDSLAPAVSVDVDDEHPYEDEYDYGSGSPYDHDDDVDDSGDRSHSDDDSDIRYVVPVLGFGFIILNEMFHPSAAPRVVLTATPTMT
jgi:hypothetical protein